MTHPDDEIFICAWIKKLVDNGNDVWISWTHSTAVREAEARKTAAMLGVLPSQLKFFHGTDQGICDEIPQLLVHFDSFITEVMPDRVVCAAFEQGHIDHDATNFIVNQCFKGTVLEIPLYHNYSKRLQRMNVFSEGRDQVELRLTPVERKLKRQIARNYPSQNILSVLLAYATMQALTLQPVELGRREYMRVQTHFDWSTPNHPTNIAEQVAKSKTWARWCEAVKSVELAPKVPVTR